MTELHTNISLKPYHTFGIDEYTNGLFKFHETNELQNFINSDESKKFKKLMPIGIGSNLLFTQKFDGCLLQCTNETIETVESNKNFAVIKTGAGLDWDKFVEWTVNNNLYGIENLSLIPGTTGATPVQNIGAYGVEVQDTIISCDAVNLETCKKTTFQKKDIQFGYRDSIFKNELKDKYFITSVNFRLEKKAKLNIKYGSVKAEISKIGELNLQNIRQAIINIRNSKLPDYTITGNAGSFFKNPVVKESVALKLLKNYPEMPLYNEQPGMKKLAAGWLIDQCGLKGYETQNGAAVHDKQALVIINKNAKSGKEIVELAEYIANKVQSKFEIVLEPEVKIL